MKAYRIAYTMVDKVAMFRATGNAFDPWNTDASASDVLAEFAGRGCYRSWSRPNTDTAANADYLRSTVAEKAHESITAHASVTYHVTGISRSLTHELLRHRWLAFSETSQRYVDMSDAKFVLPPALNDGVLSGLNAAALSVLAGRTTRLYEAYVEDLTAWGLTRKQAREAARCVLPNATETEITVTGNIRAWRDFLRQRWHCAADAEIRALAGMILADLRVVAPNSVQDIPETPYE